MVSKAQKLKLKKISRGRPFIQNVAREPNGRISRAKRIREPADNLALKVRARKMGVSVNEARDPRLATYIGRLAILGIEEGAGGISDTQYEAALKFLEVRNRYLWAIGSPAAIHEESGGVLDDVGYAEATKRDIVRYEAMMEAVSEAQFFNRSDNLVAALQYLVVDDVALPHMVGTLRVALNLLCHHFFIDKCMS